MLENLKDSWHRFKENPPGHRFQQRYEERRQSERSRFRKVTIVGGGILIMAAGVFLLAVPGPGMVVLFVGASVIAEESRTAARLLDWTEVRARRIVAWTLTEWRSSSPGFKFLLVIGAMALAGAIALGAFMLLLVSVTA